MAFQRLICEKSINTKSPISEEMGFSNILKQELLKVLLVFIFKLVDTTS